MINGRRMRPMPPERVGSGPRGGMVVGLEVAFSVSMRVLPLMKTDS
jgi:hypothetical protein